MDIPIKIFPEYNYNLTVVDSGKTHVKFETRVRKLMNGKWHIAVVKDLFYIDEKHGINPPLAISSQFVQNAYEMLQTTEWHDLIPFEIDKCQLNESERLKRVRELETIRVIGEPSLKDVLKERELKIIKELGGEFYL